MTQGIEVRWRILNTNFDLTDSQHAVNEDTIGLDCIYDFKVGGMMASKHFSFIGSWVIAGTSSFLFIKFGGYSIHRVEGPSMQPTLNPNNSYINDYIIVKKINDPQNSNLVNSIISLHHPKQKNSYLIKRLIANENEIVRLPKINSSNQETYTKFIPEGHCWVISDAGPGYRDSTLFGPISYDKIVGKAVCIIWPPGRIQKL